MKNLTLTLFAIALFSWPSMAQQLLLDDLTAFNKVIIRGNVAALEIKRGETQSPKITLEGATRDKVDYYISGGVLTLLINSQEPVQIKVVNSQLRRIESDGQIAISGAETIGDHGHYLVTSFNRGHTGTHVAMDDFEFHIPNIEVDIPEIAVQIPELPALPDMDFDFVHFDDTWELHKIELRNLKNELEFLNEEDMLELKNEMKMLKEQMKQIRISN